MIVDNKEINFICFAPCPVERPLMARLEHVQKEHELSTGNNLTFVLPSFADNKQKFDKFSAITGLDMLPDVVVSMGFGDFMEHGFLRKFVNSENFADCSIKDMNKNFINRSYIDKEGCYSLISTFPLVFLADMNELGNLPVPETWSDILDEKYAGKVGISGKNDTPNDAALLTIFKYFGEDGLRKIARNVAAVGGYSKIVNDMAGKEQKPAIYAIPYYFALKEISNPKMKLIWPKDGAILEPVYMLVKKTSHKMTDVFSSYMTGKGFGELSAQTGFPVPHADIDNKLPEGAGFMWVGWDFIRNNDIHRLKKDLGDMYRRNK